MPRRTGWLYTWCWKFVPEDELEEVAFNGGFGSGAEESRRCFDDWFFFNVYLAKTREYKVAVEGGFTGEITLSDEDSSVTWRVIDEDGTVLEWGFCDGEPNALDNADEALFEMENCLDGIAGQE